MKTLVEREDEAYCFRLHKNRVYYVSERLMKKATNVWRQVCAGISPLCCPSATNSRRQRCMQVSREKLASLGVQIGRWTHSGKFRLGIGALDILAQHAKYKVRFSTCGGRQASCGNAAPLLASPKASAQLHHCVSSKAIWEPQLCLTVGLMMRLYSTQTS